MQRTFQALRIAVNEEFVKKNVNFKKGADDIGYGLRPGHALEKDAKSNGYPGADGKPVAGVVVSVVKPQSAANAATSGSLETIRSERAAP